MLLLLLLQGEGDTTPSAFHAEDKRAANLAGKPNKFQGSSCSNHTLRLLCLRLLLFYSYFHRKEGSSSDNKHVR